MRAAKEWGFVRILRACLARRARLKAWRFRNPKPPRDFGLHIFFQPIQEIFGSWFFCPNPKIPHHSFKLITKAFWKLKVTHCVGGDSLGHCLDKNFLPPPPPKRATSLFQPTNFKPTLSLISAKTYFLDLPMMEGRPRYLLCLESYMGPKMLKIASFSSRVVFGLK